MKLILQAFLMVVVLSIVTGLFYPMLTTALAVVFFPAQSHGSLSYTDGQVSGSRLIGQNFTNRTNFWPRPSATNYSAMPSGASNLNPISGTLRTLIDTRRESFQSAHGLNAGDITPGEMLFASGSGLDPDISPEAALLQIGRIAKERNFTDEQKLALASLVEHATIARQFGFLGSNRVNVLHLNQELERLDSQNK